VSKAIWGVLDDLAHVLGINLAETKRIEIRQKELWIEDRSGAIRRVRL